MGRSVEVAFAGAGQMGEALIRGLLEAGFCGPKRILASDIRGERAAEIEAKYGIRATRLSTDLPGQCRTLILAVKPQDMAPLLSDLGPKIGREHLILSVAAGVSVAFLEARLGKGARVIRAMPNMPCLIGKGCTALAPGKAASSEDMDRGRAIFQAVGAVVEAQEKWMDAITGLNGSGPAYAFLFLEALVEAGVRMGLPRPLARTLALHTTHGAAEMLLATGEHPAVLKDQVASPGGTTLAGLAALERGGFRSLLHQAVEAATRRSEELGRQMG
jgi:pyrroline-5-carboxylate reductase